MSRFQDVWAKVSRENQWLKAIAVTLSLSIVIVCIQLVEASNQEPFVVDRGCTSNAVVFSSSAHTQDEINAFIVEALRSRFEAVSDINLDLLSPTEQQRRLGEQADLKRRSMTQRILVNATVAGEGIASVDADRLISVGEVRSAFRFPLELTFASTTRTIQNPYGLVLTTVNSAKSGGVASEPTK